MSILITGVAGFIGNYVAKALLDRGEEVIGVDNLNSYYDINLKKSRLNRINLYEKFIFLEDDIANEGLYKTLSNHENIDRIVHLAAQAGVRYSLKNPYEYVNSNLIGHLRILEFARSLKKLNNLVYASSSSVYGGNEDLPFSIGDRVDKPISLYAATKKSDELMSFAYSHLFGIVQTGLRFFTVYGPWGRPDMALYIFTKAIQEESEIKIFNYGEMWRDFTYIDDIVKGTLAALDKAPSKNDKVPHRVYNLGNDRSEKLLYLIDIIEKCIGKKAKRKFEPMQLGDVKETRANIEESKVDLGFNPQVNLSNGVPLFVDWYKQYHK